MKLATFSSDYLDVTKNLDREASEKSKKGMKG